MSDVGAGAVPPLSEPRKESWRGREGRDGAGEKEEEEEEEEEDEEVRAAEGVLTYEYDADASMSFSDVTSGVRMREGLKNSGSVSIVRTGLREPPPLAPSL